MARIKLQYNRGELKSLHEGDPVVIMDAKIYYHLLPAIKGLHKKAVARYEKLHDIHESGEATEKQQTDLMIAENLKEMYEELISIAE